MKKAGGARFRLPVRLPGPAGQVCRNPENRRCSTFVCAKTAKDPPITTGMLI